MGPFEFNYFVIQIDSTDFDGLPLLNDFRRINNQRIYFKTIYLSNLNINIRLSNY